MPAHTFLRVISLGSYTFPTECFRHNIAKQPVIMQHKPCAPTLCPYGQTMGGFKFDDCVVKYVGVLFVHRGYFPARYLIFILWVVGLLGWHRKSGLNRLKMANRNLCGYTHVFGLRGNSP